MIHYLHRFTTVAGLLILTGLLLIGPGVAAKSINTSNSTSAAGSSSQPSDISGQVPQTYSATSKVLPGMLVELKDANTVQPLTAKDVKKMLGVVIPTAQAAVILSPQLAPSGQALVATTGRNQMLVSTQDGPIKSGDFLTISALDGVAMKASDAQAEIIGRATTAFDGKHGVLGTVSLKSSKGNVSVNIGSVVTDLELKQNPLQQKAVSYLPQFVVNAAVGIAQKPVASGRIYLGVILMFITLFIVSNMLYSGVRSGMVAIGRNPLSRKSIIRSLAQTVIAGLIIFAGGVFAVYLILKL
ncbi:MAG TPA: hypothetical protein VH234_04225 [Candidatus Saccharimonadales bacterium]|nr:hypothetical protein [Candidatus Saccharimonadales bacterium]